MMAQQQAEAQQMLQEIDNQYKQNHMQVIDRLLESIMNVHIEVPRTVCQNYKKAQEDWSD